MHLLCIFCASWLHQSNKGLHLKSSFTIDVFLYRFWLYPSFPGSVASLVSLLTIFLPAFMTWPAGLSLLPSPVHYETPAIAGLLLVFFSPCGAQLQWGQRGRVCGSGCLEPLTSQTIRMTWCCSACCCAESWSHMFCACSFYSWDRISVVVKSAVVPLPCIRWTSVERLSSFPPGMGVCDWCVNGKTDTQMQPVTRQCRGCQHHPWSCDLIGEQETYPSAHYGQRRWWKS